MKKLLNPVKISGKIIKAQVEYKKCPASFDSAKQIVLSKLRSSILILTDYIHSRQRYGYEYTQLVENQNKLTRLKNKILVSNNIKELFLLEARIARIHWKSFRILCKLPDSWKRIYPHAKDTVNVVLNTGYTLLEKHCYKVVTNTGLMTQLGIYHSDNENGASLVYDFMEIFRIPIVDSTLISFLSRRPSLLRLDNEGIFKSMLFEINKSYQMRFLYSKKWEYLDRIMTFESFKLKKAIVNEEKWIPFAFSWGHRKRRK